MRNPEQASKGAHNPSGHEIPVAEWIAAAAGLLIVLVAVGFLCYRLLWIAESAPKITVTVLAIEPQDTSYLVRTRVANTGTKAAAQVVIEGALKAGTGQEQRSQVTLDYVPAGSERSAGFLFSTDPRQGELVIRPLGFQDP